MNFVFVMIHIHEFYFVLEVSRHQLTTSIDIPCPRPNYEGEVFMCSVDKKNQLDVTFCILYFSSNSCWTCFRQPCAHHQELTTAWCYSLVLVCYSLMLVCYSLVLVCYSLVLAGSASDGRTTCQPDLTTFLQPRHIPTQGYNTTSRSCQLLMMGTRLPETCWASIRREIKNTKRFCASSWLITRSTTY